MPAVGGGPDRKPRYLRARLSLLMFLQYAAPGALVPLFSLRLKHLGFAPLEIGLCCATGALGAIVAPLFAGQVADRWYASERCIACSALVAGLLLCVLAGLSTPLAVFLTSLAFWMAMVPAITLGTSLCFANLRRPESDFGFVRMWGTLGWVVPGWLLGYWFSKPAWLADMMPGLGIHLAEENLADAFRLGGVLAFTQAAYALTLPHTPPQHQSGSWLAPLSALRLLRRRAFAVYFAGTLGVCITIPFTSQVTPLLLENLGIPRPWLFPTMTIAQSMEFVSLGLLPMLLLRLGIRGTMLLGLGSWALALWVLTLGRPAELVIGTMGLNGLCVCCFLVAGQVFVNSQARGDLRASTQGLFTFTNGVGLLIGNLLVGWVRWYFGERFPPTFGVGAIVATILLAAFLVGFPDDDGSVGPVR